MAKYLLFGNIFVYNIDNMIRRLIEMKLLSRLVVALVICVMVLPGLAVPALAQDDEPSITVSPSSGRPGEEVTVKGYDFEYREEVDIYYYLDSTRVKVATDEADSDGDFRVDFTVPESCTGQHRVRADGDEGSDADDNFEVEPGLEVDPEQGPVGTRVTVKGMGFGEDEDDIEVRYYFNGDYETVAQNIRADDDGSWQTTFSVPVSSKGNHKIYAKGDDSSLGDVEDVTFEVEPGISLSKTSGHVGDTITVSGSGFKRNETGIRVTFDEQQVGSTTSANTYGEWTISFEVPPGAAGRHEIDAYGSSTRATDIADKAFSWSLLNDSSCGW